MPVTNRLQQPLDRLCREFDWARRVEQDAIQFPLPLPRSRGHRDRGPLRLLHGVRPGRPLRRMGHVGARPHGRVARPLRLELRSREAPEVFAGFRYRFNRDRDVLAFCLAAQRVLASHGSLQAFFLEGYSPAHPHVGLALEHFANGFVGGISRRSFPEPALLRLQALVPASLDGRRVQASPSLPALDGQARAARFRDLAGDSSLGPPHARGYAYREHGALHRAHAPAQPHLADGGGADSRAPAPRSR